MIIKVKQTKATIKNKFEIEINNELKYLAGSPWMDIDLPFGLENVRSDVITDTDGNIRFLTSYDIARNITESLIPMKWLVTGEQKKGIYWICDGENNICGRFYKAKNDVFDAKFVIEYGVYSLKCYDVAAGKTRNIMIYNEGTQIAEMVKPLSSVNNLDEYYIFLLDEYSELAPVISFFAVYFDRKYYANSGEIAVKKKRVSVEYTFDKNNSYYDKKWIANNFDAEAVEAIYSDMKKKRDSNSKSIKKGAKILGLTIGLAWLIILAGTALYYYLNGYFSCGPNMM